MKFRYLKQYNLLSKCKFYCFLIQFCAFSLLFVTDMNAQKYKSVRDVEVSIPGGGETIFEIFEQIEAQTDYRFSYDQKKIKQKDVKLNLAAGKKSVADLLLEISQRSNLQFKQINNAINVKEREKGNDDRLKVVIDEKARQGIRIKGKVTGENEAPVPGVSVVEKGTSNGIATDLDGNYSFSVSGPGATLMISSVGFETKEVVVGNQTVINVTLSESLAQLDEVVLIGYGQQAKREVVGSTVRATTEDIALQPTTNALTALQGVLPGLEIINESGRPGAPVNIRIRGINSTNPDAQPLVLIDNVPGDLTMIAPADIESVDVLKDAAATAIFGSRGTHGVILVTTKRGGNRKPRISFQAYTSVSEASKVKNMLNSDQYRELRREAFANDSITINEFNAPDLFLPYDSTVNTNWGEVFFQEAITQEYNLGISGGNGGTSYFISGGLRDEEAPIEGDWGLTRYNFRTNIDALLTDNLSVGGGVSYVLMKNKFYDQVLIPNLNNALPVIPALDSLGNTNLDILNGGLITNPNRLATPYTETKNYQILGNSYLDYFILADLNFHTDISFNTQIGETRGFDPTVSGFRNNDNNSASLQNSNSSTFNVEPRLTYSKNFEEHSLTAMLGGTYLSTNTTLSSITTRTIGNANDNLNTIANGEPIQITFSELQYRFQSLFGRLNYNFGGRYYLQASLRQDGSSRFGANNRYGSFWSIGGGWVLSGESFVKNLVGDDTFIKLYSSYGITGTDAIGDFQFLATSSAPFNSYNNSTTLVADRLENKNLKWEETNKFNVGLTFNTWNDRVNLNVEYYRSITTDMLFNGAVSNVTGFGRAPFNLDGEVENKGVELSLTLTPVQTQDFTWISRFNISTIKNELLSLPNLEFAPPFVQRNFKVGETLDRINGFNFLGVDSETGIAMFEDLGEEGLIIFSEDDAITVGKRLPDNYGGWINTLIFKNWEFFVQAQFVNGVDREYGLGGIEFGTNVPVFMLDRWQNPGDVTDIPRLSVPGTAAYNVNRLLSRSSFAYDDASYVRIKNVTLSYTFPGLLNGNIESLRLYATGYNLFTITDFKGADPEIGGLFTPAIKSYTLGLNLTF